MNIVAFLDLQSENIIDIVIIEFGFQTRSLALSTLMHFCEHIISNVEFDVFVLKYPIFIYKKVQ
jgi:hypothetical protein